MQIKVFDKDGNSVVEGGTYTGSNSEWEVSPDMYVSKSNGTEDRGRNFDYSNMVVGTFVAFRYRGKADTAKVYAINRKRRLIKAETKMGTRYLIPFERILWVKLDIEDLWPKAILMELKGHERCRWEGVEDDPYSKNKRECEKII